MPATSQCDPNLNLQGNRSSPFAKFLQQPYLLNPQSSQDPQPTPKVHKNPRKSTKQNTEQFQNALNLLYLAS